MSSIVILTGSPGRTSATFASRGYHVILDGIFVPGFLPVMATELQATGVCVQYVVLRAPLEIALRRVQDRIGHEKDHVVRLIHAAFSDLGPYAAHAVDTGTRDVDAVAAELGPSLDRGDFILDLSQVVHGSRLDGAVNPPASFSTGLPG